jgi:hypothetical protein
VQDLQKLAAKGATISLLLGIKNEWDPSTIELLNSQAFMQNSRALQLRKLEVLTKKPA